MKHKFHHSHSLGKRGNLFLEQDGKKIQLCQVVLKTFLSGATSSHPIPKQSNLTENNHLIVEVEDCDSLSNDNNAKSSTRKSIAMSNCRRNVCPVVAKEQLECLQIRGTLNVGELPLQCLHHDTIYAVLPTGETSTKDMCTDLFQLLHYLASNKLVLIVDISTKGDVVLPITAVLQPLTLATATLTFLKSDVTVLVRKLLKFTTQKSDDRSETGFIGEMAQNLAHKPGTKRITKDMIEKEHYSNATNEGWLKSGVVSRKTDALKSAINSCGCIEDDEKKMLQLLKKCYREERHDKTHYLNRTSNISNSNQSDEVALHRGNSPKGKNKTLTEKTRLSHSRSFTAPSKVAKNLGARTLMIMNQAKQEVMRREETRDEEVTKEDDLFKGIKKTSTASLQSVDITNEEQMIHHLKDCYRKGLEGTMELLTTVQSIVQVALHFFRMNQSENLHARTRDFVTQHLCVSFDDIRINYKTKSTTLEEKVKDFELQVLLRLELESIIYSSEGPVDGAYDDLIEEIAKFLRAVSFMKEPTYTSSFLNKTVAESYAGTTPKLVQELYDEMGQPLPASFESLFSPDAASYTTSLSSVKSDNPSVTDSVYNIMKPSSDRTLRSFRKFPSFTTASTNRQIVIPKQNHGKEKKGKRSKTEDQKVRTRMSTGAISGARKPKSPKTETVRRNLFTDSGSLRSGGGVKLERRQSIAVMQGSKKSHTTPKKLTNRQSSVTTPKAHHILKTKIVTETPRHKQISRITRESRHRSKTAPDMAVVLESPDKITPTTIETGVQGKKGALRNGGRKSFYDPNKKSRSVANAEKALAEKYKMLAERMTSTKTLSPGPVSIRAKCKSSPSRRIRPVNLFSALASPSPPRRHILSNSQKFYTESNVFKDMKADHHRLLEERMISTKPLGLTSPVYTGTAHQTMVKETPPRRIQPVKLLFASPSPPKTLPALAAARAKGGLLMRALSHDSTEESPSKRNRVTFSPKPSIQKMYSKDSPRKLLQTPTKLYANSTTKSPMKSILKSPLRSPPHFNMFFTQQPSPLINDRDSATSYTPKKAWPSTPRSKALTFSSWTPSKRSPSPTHKVNAVSVVRGVTGLSVVSKDKMSPQTERTDDNDNSTSELADFTKSPRLRSSRKAELKAVRKIFSQVVGKVSETTEAKTDFQLLAESADLLPDNSRSSPHKSSFTRQEKEQVAVPVSSVPGVSSPHKRIRGMSLRKRISPSLINRSLIVSTTPNKEKESLIKEFNSPPTTKDETDPNSLPNKGDSSPQESDVRTPKRRLRKKVNSVKESPSFDNTCTTRSKRQRSPDDPVSERTEASTVLKVETPSKKRKTDTSTDVCGNEYFTTSEIFASTAIHQLPQVTNISCSTFTRLGSNSNDFDTSQAGMLRSRLRSHTSAASDSNSNMSYDLPSSPVFMSGSIPRHKSLDRILSSGCDVHMSESDSSRSSSPVFGSHLPPSTTMETLTSTSPSKATELIVTPVATRSKTSPGIKKYSPNVSAKSIAELISSPFQTETISPSSRKTILSKAAVNNRSSPVSVKTDSSIEENKPRSRRSLYRTETKSSL